MLQPWGGHGLPEGAQYMQTISRPHSSGGLYCVVDFERLARQRLRVAVAVTTSNSNGHIFDAGRQPEPRR